jgi:hypothetical protein
MAKAPTPNERTEREFQHDVNQAVANTEGEIFEDALGDEPLENDGDTSLEEMGDGLEGDDLEDEEGPDEEADEEEAEEAEGEGEEPAEGEEAEAAKDDEEEPPRDERGRFEDRQPPGQPPSRRLAEESQRRREAEERATRFERELAELRGRVDEQSRRPPQPQVEQPKPPKPDQFADPEGWERYIRDEARRDAEKLVTEQMQAYQQQEQQRLNAHFDQSMGEAAQGERSEELDAAYGRLKSLDPKNPSHVAIVQGIFRASDPAAALFRWWDRNGGTQYRASEEYQNRVQDKLDRAEQDAERYRSLLPGRQNSRQRSQQPRHETRLPESLRRTGPPSLNSARGGQRQEVQDPDMMDDSDDAVMRYAMRR